MTDPMTIATTTLASFDHIANLFKTLLRTRDNLANLEQYNTLQSEIASIQTGYLARSKICRC